MIKVAIYGKRWYRQVDSDCESRSSLCSWRDKVVQIDVIQRSIRQSIFSEVIR